MRQDEVMSKVLFSMRHFNVEDTAFWSSKCLMANSTVQGSPNTLI